MKVHVGTSGFAYQEWRGSFYPEGIRPDGMLRAYAKRLGAVEINNSFYRMPTERLLETWSGEVPKSFVFAFKAPRVITHFKGLRDVGEEVDRLFAVLTKLGPRLGPVLFQLPGSFHADRPALEALLAGIPGDPACAFDFRSPTWLEGGIPELLREQGCALCVEDTDERPASGILSTASWGYLRLRRADYAEEELAAWADRILAQPWKKAFVFVKHEDGPRGPSIALRLRELVEERAAQRPGRPPRASRR